MERGMGGQPANNAPMKGTLKREMDTIELHDCQISRLIVDCLLAHGYSITTLPIRNEMNIPVGEKLTIYTPEVMY